MCGYALKLEIASVASVLQYRIVLNGRALLYVLIKHTHTDIPASIMDLPSSLSSNEKDLKQRRVVPESQTLCTYMAQIAYTIPESKAEVLPETVKTPSN